ncbi:MAG: hypothetical protein SNJ55_06280 [Chloroherpetonaceae bacterium]
MALFYDAKKRLAKNEIITRFQNLMESLTKECLDALTKPFATDAVATGIGQKTKDGESKSVFASLKFTDE